MAFMAALPLITTALSAYMAHKGAENQNDNIKAANRAAAAQTKYSAWSGLGQGKTQHNFADPGSAAIGGGIQGYAAGQSMANGMGGTQAPEGTMMAGQGYDAQNPMPQQGVNPWQGLQDEMARKQTARS